MILLVCVFVRLVCLAAIRFLNAYFFIHIKQGLEVSTIEPS